MSPTVRIVAVLFVLLWATGFIGARYAMPYAEPFSFLAVRFVIAAVLLVLAAIALGAQALPRREALHACFAGMLIHGIYLGGVFWAIDNGMPAGLSALVIGLQPLVTALVAGRWLAEPILPRHWVGLALGLAGIAMVLAPKLDVGARGVTPLTLFACLVAVVAISAGTVWQKRFVAGGDLVTGTAWQYVGGAIPVGVAAAMFETGRYELTGELVFAMAWLIVVLSLGAVFLLMYLIREGAVARVASLFYLVPAVTALIAWQLFGETLSPFQIAGMAVATIGVALSVRQPVTRMRASL